MAPVVRVLHCPACRAERIARRVNSTTVYGHPMDLVQCQTDTCELVWAVRPDLATTPARKTA